MSLQLFGTPEMVPVNGDRVRQARELRGLTQAALAMAVGVDQTMIAHIERGTKQPAPELLEALAGELKLSESFFRQQSQPKLSEGSLLFRAKAGVGKRKIAQAHAYSELVFEIALSLCSKVSAIPIRIQHENDPVEAAIKIRRAAGLAPDEPVPHVVRLAEKLGVIIVPLPASDDCDAFAVWGGSVGTIPVMGLWCGKSGDRIRMNVAHELGHLTLHRNISASASILEAQAYQFASALLMPAEPVTKDLSAEPLNLFHLAKLKRKWKVSMQALLRRARDLHLITDRQYRYLSQQIGAKGWRTHEPDLLRVAVEKPRALRKMAEEAFGMPLKFDSLSRELDLPVEFVREIFSQYDGPNDSAKDYPSSKKKVIAFRKDLLS